MDQFLKRLGLNPQIEEEAGAVISLADYYRLQSRLAVLIGDETLHLSSRQLLPGSTDYALRNLADCNSLGDVMRSIARSYNLLHGGEYNLVQARGDRLDYIIDDRAFPYKRDQTEEYICFAIECTLIFLHCILLIVSPKAAQSLSTLHVRRLTPGGDCAHLGYWTVPIRFGAPVYRLGFDAAAVHEAFDHQDLVHLTADSVYQKIIHMVAERGRAGGSMTPISAQVRAALLAGVCEQADIARQMQVSVATLRRQLAGEGTNFRMLRRTTLNEKARRLLRSQCTVEEVAEALGFAEFRSFNRAFKEWNGQTPVAFVREHKRSLTP